jgi:hypothetical protein
LFVLLYSPGGIYDVCPFIVHLIDHLGYGKKAQFFANIKIVEKKVSVSQPPLLFFSYTFTAILVTYKDFLGLKEIRNLMF